MKCPECGKEMREGYLFCSKDGAFSFANEVPGVFENAKNADGFVKITDLKASHRTRVPASICEECRTARDKNHAGKTNTKSTFLTSLYGGNFPFRAV